jgi:hypothetical protein
LAPPTTHEDPHDVTYIVVVATILRELANRESGCIFALVFAGGSALTMPFRLPRFLLRSYQARAGTNSAPGACL